MTHPQQIIRNIDDDFNLMILKEGEIGYPAKITAAISMTKSSIT